MHVRESNSTLPIIESNEVVENESNHTFCLEVNAITVSKWKQPSMAVPVGKHDLKSKPRAGSSIKHVRFGQVRGQLDELPPSRRQAMALND